LVAILGVCLFGFPFLEGVQHAAMLYHQGAYSQAYDVYKKLEPKTSDIWYNMGNCSYKSGDTQNAFICWERSLKNCSSKDQQDCYDTVRFASEKSGVTYDMESSWLEQSIQHVHFGVWQLVLLLAWYLMCWSIRSYKRSWYTAVLLSLNLLLGYCVASAYRLEKRVVARVTTPHARLLVGPNEQVHVITQLNYMERLTVIGTHGSWYKVRMGSTQGWIAMGHVEIV
jgi:tetratricopeptide (TPR) repeat protein